MKPKVLIASYLEPYLVQEIKDKVPQVEVVYRPDLLYKPTYVGDHTTKTERSEAQEKEWRKLLADAEILFDFDFTHVNDLPELAPNVKWLQATSAGIGQFVKRNGYDSRTNWIFTTSSGVHARPLAEFVIMSMLMFVKEYFLNQAQQTKHEWKRYCASQLSNYTLGIVGLGKIGREIARLAKAFDMKVVGTRRRNSDGREIPNVDEVYGPGELGKVLSQSNFLCLSCPHTPETEGLIGAKELAMLPPRSVLINISRGAVVDEQALINSLKSGHLGGAALDVFEKEPLPQDSPLWDLANVIVVPHSASTSLNENKLITELFCENLVRYVSGKPLLNVLDTSKLY